MNPFGTLSTPQRITHFYQAVIGLAVLAVGWALVIGAVSLLSWWVMILITAALAVAVYVRGQKAGRRQTWIDAGHCAQCGYDLQGSPTRTCPECGRDSTLDEPAWRRLRREHEAKYGRAPTASETTAAAELDEAQIRKLLARAEQSTLDL